MDELIETEKKNELVETNEENGLVELSKDMLLDARNSIQSEKTIKLPIGQMASLGAKIATLVPELNHAKKSLPDDGLYRLANASSGDALKMAKNGNYWGAMKTANGKSKMAQLTKVDPSELTKGTSTALNPATIMIAAALYSIEKDLTDIKETQKKILTFLEIENESQIEADVESLMEITTNYKYNWDNEISVNSSHQLVTDIKNRSRKNVIAYQKKVGDAISSKKLLVTQSKVKSELSDLEKKFKYYRLSLYTLSFATMLDIMLSGNYKEEYLLSTSDEIQKLSEEYSQLFEKGSSYLGKLGSSEIEAKALNGIGFAGKSIGKFIEGIPLVKKGKAGEYLSEKGSHLENNAIEMKKHPTKEFSVVKESGTKVFIEKMRDMNQIYNHTKEICFDKETIYLLSENE